MGGLAISFAELLGCERLLALDNGPALRIYDSLLSEKPLAGSLFSENHKAADLASYVFGDDDNALDGTEPLKKLPDSP